MGVQVLYLEGPRVLMNRSQLMRFVFLMCDCLVSWSEATPCGVLRVQVCVGRQSRLLIDVQSRYAQVKYTAECLARSLNRQSVMCLNRCHMLAPMSNHRMNSVLTSDYWRYAITIDSLEVETCCGLFATDINVQYRTNNTINWVHKNIGAIPNIRLPFRIWQKCWIEPVIATR